ncbi:MAG: cyanophycinase [Planctomycetaceae bacterium]|nr:cyanophycinase [Planctomycetaceae bacterium]
MQTTLPKWWTRRLCRQARRAASTLLVVVLLVASTRGDTFPAPRLTELGPTGIQGALVVCGGGKLPDAVLDRFVELAGAEKARLVVIPTASERADEADLDSYAKDWRDRGFRSVAVLHTCDRVVADSNECIAPLETATAVWFVGGQQSRIAKAYVGTRVERELYALLNRGGVIGGTSAGAAIQSRLMIAFGNPEATLMQGLNLLPGAVIDQHFKVRKRQPRLTAVLAKHPGYFGLGVDERTGLVVRGRWMQVVGESSVTVCLSKSATRPALQYEIPAGKAVDLTALRRAAIARAAPTFPPKSTGRPHVERGSLMIVGGGRMTAEMWQRFVELAGGSQARIVIVPTAVERPRLEDRPDVREFQEAGAKTVTILHTTDRSEADRDAFIEPLRQATGVWFGGGRQWRIVDAYERTASWKAFHDVLRRGGVIGGSSAGTTIQGEYLVRGNPLGNRDMMAEGYERGFTFLPGSAIDQHFSQRRRQRDMQALKQTSPQLLGIGIDESTAIVVQKTTADVIGKNDVYFYDGSPGEDSEEPEFTKVVSGKAYDLQRRMRIE